MSAEQFVQKLSQLGYPGAANMRSDSCVWLFQNPDLAPFLNFFCNDVLEENILSAEEVNQFNAMVDAGEEILSLHQLEKMEKVCNTPMLSIVQQEKETTSLQKKLKNEEHQLLRLEILRTRLSKDLRNISHQNSLLEDLDRKTHHDRKYLNEKCHIISATMDATAKETMNLLLDIEVLLDSEKQSSPIYLTFFPLRDIIKANNLYERELEIYLAEQLAKFPEVVNDVSQEFKKDSDGSNPKKDWTKSTCSTLSCTEWEKVIENEVDNKRHDRLRDIGTRLKLSSESSILAPAEKALNEAMEEIHDLVIKCVQMTLDAGKMEQCEEILGQKRKIISTLDKSMSHLLGRCSANQFINELLLLDLNKFKAQPISQLHEDVLQQVSGFQSRLTAMKNLKELIANLQSRKQYNNIPIDCLVSILHAGQIHGQKNSENSNELCTLEDVCKELMEFSVSCDHLQQLRTTYLTDQTNQLHQIVECVNMLKNAIWRDYQTKCSPPQLSPKVIIDAKEDLQKAQDTLSARLLPMLKSYQENMKIIKCNPEGKRERQAYLEIWN